MKLPSRTIFYEIEKAIKEYRRFAQKKINEKFKDITIDQALILFFLQEDSSLSQNEMADLLFKDNASITRMVESLVKKKYLERFTKEDDRRKYTLSLTDQGETMLKVLYPIVRSNREKALKGISENELQQLKTILKKLTDNCKNG